MESIKHVKLEIKSDLDRKSIAKFIAQHLKDGYKLKLVNKEYNNKTKLIELTYEATPKGNLNA